MLASWRSTAGDPARPRPRPARRGGHQLGGDRGGDGDVAQELGQLAEGGNLDPLGGAGDQLGPELRLGARGPGARPRRSCWTSPSRCSASGERCRRWRWSAPVDRDPSTATRTDAVGGSPIASAVALTFPAQLAPLGGSPATSPRSSGSSPRAATSTRSAALARPWSAQMPCSRSWRRGGHQLGGDRGGGGGGAGGPARSTPLGGSPATSPRHSGSSPRAATSTRSAALATSSGRRPGGGTRSAALAQPWRSRALAEGGGRRGSRSWRSTAALVLDVAQALLLEA